MTKQCQILTLIESEIIVSKLILSLNDIGVDADKYYTDISTVVLVQMGFKKQDRTDKLYEEYFNFIRQVRYLDLTIQGNSLKLAVKLYDYLLTKV